MHSNASKSQTESLGKMSINVNTKGLNDGSISCDAWPD